MDEAAIAALGLDDVEQGQSVFGEVIELAGFDHAGGRVIWGINVCGNSFVCVVRCTAPAAGKVSACKGDVGLSAIQAWQTFSPDARRFAHLSSHMAEPPLTVFDVAGYARRAPDRQPAAPIVAAAFTADNTHLAVLTTADQLVVYAIGADGTPRHQRAIGLGRGRAEERCTGSDRMVARHGPQVAVLSGDCTLQLLDVAAGRLLWRTRLDVDARAQSNAQLVATTQGGSLLVVAGGRARLIHAETGAALSAPLDRADLAGVQRADAGTARLVTHAGDGAPAVDVGGQLFVRSSPPSAAAARAVLPVLDRYTLISTADGRTPLDRVPGR